MHVTDVEGVEFVDYHLKDMAYQWFEEWDETRGDDTKSALQDDFLGAFLDCFFPKKLRKVTNEVFVNLIQGKMSKKEYTLKFY